MVVTMVIVYYSVSSAKKTFLSFVPSKVNYTIIRPHRMHAYVARSVVCVPVCLSVRWSRVCCANTADPIEMPFVG